jgi:hypothetical protein
MTALLALSKRPPKVTAVELTAGVLLGVGNLALLGLVTRSGPGWASLSPS